MWGNGTGYGKGMFVQKGGGGGGEVIQNQTLSPESQKMGINKGLCLWVV